MTSKLAPLSLTISAKKINSNAPVKTRVVLVTTQVELSDSVEKVYVYLCHEVSPLSDYAHKLNKIGIKKTTFYAECTHLLAKNVVRTEKFMVSLASAPWILTEKWATDSAKIGEFQRS
jgi:hypothetical protein